MQITVLGRHSGGPDYSIIQQQQIIRKGIHHKIRCIASGESQHPFSNISLPLTPKAQQAMPLMPWSIETCC